jgi:hypothetical protein
MKNFLIALLTIATIATLAAPPSARAAADPSTRHFVTTMLSHLADQIQRTGDLAITIGADGGISGTYRSTSGGPGSDKPLAVTGGLRGDAIQLDIGQNDEYKIVGTLDDNGIIGTAYDASRKQYDFVARNA